MYISQFPLFATTQLILLGEKEVGIITYQRGSHPSKINNFINL